MPLRSRVMQKMSKDLNLTSNQFEVVEYGYIAFTQILCTILLVAFFGYILGILWPSLLVLFASSILRQFSGGAHASRPSICLFIGALASVGFAYIATLLSQANISFVIIIIIIILSFIISYIVIYKKAPIDHPNKPINSEFKRRRMRNYSLITLSLYLLVVLILQISFKTANNSNYTIYVYCILLGVFWQVFNITIIGHSLLGKLDSFLNNILYDKGDNI